MDASEIPERSRKDRLVGSNRSACGGCGAPGPRPLASEPSPNVKHYRCRQPKSLARSLAARRSPPSFQLTPKVLIYQSLIAKRPSRPPVRSHIVWTEAAFECSIELGLLPRDSALAPSVSMHFQLLIRFEESAAAAGWIIAGVDRDHCTQCERRQARTREGDWHPCRTSDGTVAEVLADVEGGLRQDDRDIASAS